MRFALLGLGYCSKLGIDLSFSDDSDNDVVVDVVVDGRYKGRGEVV